MKKLVVSKENPCKACLSCVMACSEAFYKKFDPDLSCIRIMAKARWRAQGIQLHHVRQMCPHMP